MSALDSLNNNNTIIENVEYLDMLDPKNSWYFDAERFDVNFPLVCSYRGDVDERTGFLYTLFNYWAHVFSYYGTKPGMTAFCLSKLGSSPPNRDLKEDIFCQEGYREVLWDIADNFSKPEFLFYFKDLYSDGTVYYRFLIGCYTDSGAAEAKGQFLKTFPLSDFTSPFYAYAPRSQLIVTRDWGLVHRYFSWVFRNHQYENSKFIYIFWRGVRI